MTTLPRLGLGCMVLNHAYGEPIPADDAIALIRTALDSGVTFLDTAALYGGGKNEELVGRAIAGRRDEVLLASKCGMRQVDGKKSIDGRPETIRETCEQSLQRLGVDHIDLYYLHRWDKSVPIAESVGALAELVTQGKIGSIGLSEVSVTRLREAQAVAPIVSVQNEYSLWTRNAELGMLEATRADDIALVSFGPLARGFLAGAVDDIDAFTEKDIRRGMPRFQPEHWPSNAALLPAWFDLAREAGCTPAQLALAWLWAQGEHVSAIPGTTRADHLAELIAAQEVVVAPDVLARAGELVNQHTVSGQRYNAAQSLEVDAETFEDAA